MTATQKGLEPIEIVSWSAEDDGPYDDPMTAAEYTVYIREQFAQRFPVGDLTGDLTRFLEADYFGIDRWQAAAALIRHPVFAIRGFADPETDRRWRSLIRERGPDEAKRLLRDVVLPAALMLAWGRHLRTERRQVGRKWLKDADERVVSVRPDELRSCGWLWRWLRQETLRRADEFIQDLADSSDIGSADTLGNDEPASGPVDAIAVGGLLEDILAELESRDPDLVDHLAVQPMPPERPRDALVTAMTEEGHSAAEIGRALELTKNAVKQLRHRIRQRRP
jgi:hypothetical protein